MGTDTQTSLPGGVGQGAPEVLVIAGCNGDNARVFSQRPANPAESAALSSGEIKELRGLQGWGPRAADGGS